MNSKARALTLAAVAAAGLSSCATPYQKEGITGGFSERRISDTAYFVSFAGNGFASRERVRWFWLYRCAELTLQQKHKLFIIETDTRTSRNADQTPGLRPAVYHAQDQGRFVRTAGPVYVPIYTPGVGTIQTFTSAGTVLMYDRPLPQELVEAWDAQAISDALGPYVKSDGKSAAPTIAELGQRALVMHDEIGVQSIGSLESATADASAANVKPLRTDASVRELLDGFVVRKMLRAGYRAAHGPGSAYRAPATAAWDLTISPNGPVTSCQLVSETLNNAKMIQDTTAMLQHLNFGPQDVRETRVKSVTYYFKPLD